MEEVTPLIDLPFEECGTGYAHLGFVADTGEAVWECILVARREGGFCIAISPEFPTLGGGVRLDTRARLAGDDGGMTDEVRPITFMDLPEEWGPCLFDLAARQDLAVDFPIEAEGCWFHGESLRGLFEEWAAGGGAHAERDALPADGGDDAAAPEAPAGRGRAGRGTGRGRAGRGRSSTPSAAGQQPRARRPSVTLSDLHSLLQDELGGIRNRLVVLEGGGGVVPPPGLVGQPGGGGMQSPLLGASPPGVTQPEAAAQARLMLGRGAGVGGASGAPVGGAFPSPGYSRADLLRAQLGYGPRASGAAAAAYGGQVVSAPAGGVDAPGVRDTALGAQAAAESASSDPTATALLALAKAITGQRGGGSLEDDFGLGTGISGSEDEYMDLWGGETSRTGGRPGGILAIEKIRRTRELRPEVVVVSHEKTARQSMGVLPGEAWSWRRHCTDQVLPHVRTFRTLRRMLVAVAAGLDEGRMGGPERMAAYFHHLYRVLESAAKEPGHDLAWGFPILGIEDPDGPRSRAGWAPAEDAALAAYHKEEHLMEQVRRSFVKGGGKGSDPAGKGGEDGEKSAAAKAKAKAAAAKAAAAKAHATPVA